VGRVITFLSESGAGIVEGDVWKGTWRDVWAGDFGARGREGGQAGWGGRECGLGRMHEMVYREEEGNKKDAEQGRRYYGTMGGRVRRASPG